jgi:DNA-binding transcriptional LysR family regulator
MVLAGMGVCFMPEQLATLPGLMTRPVDDPQAERDVQLVTVSGREHSPALRAFLKEAKGFDWQGSN